MVYTGKPSRGCQMCRTRRIKCDETKPTCNQCAKSRRQCPGYKDEFDLILRNETQATEQRARKANRKAAAHRKEKQEAGDHDGPSDDSAPATTTISPTGVLGKDLVRSSVEQVIGPVIDMPIETRANYYFVSNFVLVPKQGNSRGFFDFLIPMLKSEGPGSHLRHAFSACALALLNNRPASRNKLANKALKAYTTALNGTNAALRDPIQQKSDATLGAVILLGLFENITAKQLGTLAWGSHIEGAIQLVKMRGRKQLRSRAGLLLFIAVRTQMIIHTLTSGKAPIMGVNWWLEDAVKDQKGAMCQKLMIKTGELRAEVTRLMNFIIRSPENIEIMLDLMRRTQLVDQEVVQWMQEIPESWSPKTVAWEDHVPNGDYSKAEVFPGRVDVYQDVWICSVTNMARTARLILASITVRCAAWICSPVDYRTTPEYATAARTCAETITDIIASVPYNLGWHLKRPDLLDKAKLGHFACGEEDTLKCLAGYFLTWPLGVLNSQDYTTSPQRSWVQGRLKHIADDLGIKYAQILAELQIRIPSMLIRRDGLMASPYGAAQNFEKLLSARAAPPSAGYAMNPLQQREAMQKAYLEQHQKELIAKAAPSETTSPETQWVAQKWLTVKAGLSTGLWGPFHAQLSQLAVHDDMERRGTEGGGEDTGAGEASQSHSPQPVES